MADVKDIGSNSAEFDRYLRGLLVAPGTPATANWPGVFTLKPVTDGKISIHSGDKDYSLWLQKGASGNFDQLVLVSPEMLKQVQDADLNRGTKVGKDKVITDTTTGKTIDIKLKEIWVDFDPKSNPPTGKIISDTDRVAAGHNRQHWTVRAEQNDTVGTTISRDARFYPTHEGYRFEGKVNPKIIYESPITVAPELDAKANRFNPIANGEPKTVVNVSVETLTASIASGLLSVRTQTPIVAQPKPVPGAGLPMTPIAATTLEQLKAANYTDKLGNVAGNEAANDLYTAKMREVYTDFRNYYATGASPAQKAAAEKHIIESVNALPDGYKQLGIDYVKESMVRQGPVTNDFYANHAATMFRTNAKENLETAKRLLQEHENQLEQSAPPALARPQGDQNMPQATIKGQSQDIVDRLKSPAEIKTGEQLVEAMQKAKSIVVVIAATENANVPAESKFSQEQITEMIASYDKSAPEISRVLRDARPQIAKAAGNPALPDYQRSVDNAVDGINKAAVETGKGFSAKPATGGLPQVQVDALKAPAEMKTAAQVVELVQKAKAVVVAIAAAYNTNVPEGSKFTPSQIGQIIDSYSKTSPEIGKILNDARPKIAVAAGDPTSPNYQKSVSDAVDALNKAAPGLVPKALNIGPKREAEIAIAAAELKGQLPVEFKEAASLPKEPELVASLVAEPELVGAGVGGVKIIGAKMG